MEQSKQDIDTLYKMVSQETNCCVKYIEEKVIQPFLITHKLELAESDQKDRIVNKMFKCFDATLERFRWRMAMVSNAENFQIEEIERMTNDLRFSEADRFYLKSLCSKYIENLEQTLFLLSEALQINPNHKHSLKLQEKVEWLVSKTGIKMFEEEKYREASDNLSEAIKIIPDSSQIIPKLLYQLAFANSKIGRNRDTISDCTKAIKNNWSSISFLKLRASCLMSMRNFGKAVEDYESLLKKEDSSEVQTSLKNAQSKLEQQKSSNYYDILDVNKNATQAIIKAAYKTLALIHHPDKHCNAPPNEFIEQQEIFKKVVCAYNVLSNPQKRADYDKKQKKNDK